VAIGRGRRLAEGDRLTDAHAQIAAALGARARVLPMSDAPVRTRVMAHGRWWPLQELLIKGHGEGPVDDVDLRGARAARATPEVLGAIADARAIVIGPSNPVISIGPILAVPDLREAIRSTSAPVVAVSPLVRGAVVKGPTEPFMAWSGHSLDSDGIAAFYAGVVDGLVADEGADAIPTLQTDVLMDDPAARARVAGETLTFALGLTR
jgi:LPPG:FO 2-phospho-L-lactate transferase